MDINFRPFTENDIEELTAIMKRSFDEDARIHLNRPEGGPPGYDNGDFLRKWALHLHSTAYVIEQNKKAIGAVILWIRPDNINMLGCLYLDVNTQNKGLGLQVWKKIEEMYPETIIWKTETPGFSKRNHNFYVNKCGFHIVSISNPGDLEEESYNMEKRMK